jgi:SecD/SecF fusion protein
MLELSRWKIGLVVISVVFGFLFSLPNVLSLSVREQIKTFLPSQTVSLGLDLQGGSYLLVEVNTDKLIKDRTNNLLEEIRARLKEAKIIVSRVDLEGNTVVVKADTPDQSTEAYKIIQAMAAPMPNDPAVQMVEVSNQNGEVRARLSDEGIKATEIGAVNSSLEVISRRLDALGTKEVSVTRQGSKRIVIEAPGLSDPQAIKRILEKSAVLTFQMVDEDVSPTDIAQGLVPPSSVLLPAPDEPGGQLLVRKRVIVSGDNLTKAQVGTDQYQRPAIDFSFDGEGARKFGQTTAANPKKRFAIIMDGHVVSAPQINEPILSGSGQITGSFTHAEAAELVAVLNGGALPAELIFQEQRTVTAQLGADAVAAGALATAIAFVCVLVFMLVAYGFLFGGVAIVALLVNMLLLIGGMSMMQSTLTLPGIAGLILTLAMAVDANVIIYERMRDEVRAGRTAINALDAGFSRAFETIMDANITTIVAALIMFSLGAGPIRGFAVTLALGVVTSVFSAILITQILLALWFRHKRPKTLPIGDNSSPKSWPLIKKLPQKTNFTFVKYSKLFATLSFIVVLGSVFMAAYPFKPPCGGLNCGVDFKGGTMLEISMAPQNVDLADLRATMTKQKVDDVQIQGTNDPSEAFIRFETPEGINSSQQVDQIKSQLNSVYPSMKFVKTDVVGSKVSGELFTGGLLALLAAIGMMLVYIWFRFEWQFGLGAVIALFHDVFLTIGFFAILKLPFDLTSVAAILTIIGYSMNDTVVVFDRLRENLRKYKKMPLAELIDLSINETLSRTVITGITAIMALVGLALIGGGTLLSFSVAMIFGILIGTYSSIYVATPVILLWGVNRNAGEAEVVDMGGFKPKGQNQS